MIGMILTVLDEVQNTEELDRGDQRAVNMSSVAHSHLAPLFP